MPGATLREIHQQLSCTRRSGTLWVRVYCHRDRIMHGVRFIVGSGRSGTTWVQDALAEANGLRPVFEPLHPAVSDIGRRFAYRALSADDRYPELEQFLEEVCAGMRHKWWTQYRRPGDRLFPRLRQLTSIQRVKAEYRSWHKFWRDRPALAAAARRTEPLIKCIRANLMLGWLSQICDGRMALIVRHPGAVVESQFRLGRDRVWDPEPVLNRYRIDARLQELTGGRYSSLLARRLPRIEALTLNWVIENQWAMKNASDNGVTVVLYERLKASPGDEWQRLCRALDLPNVPPTSLIARPSQQSTDRYVGSKVSLTGEDSWWQRLSSAQIQQIQRVLDEAEFADYSMSMVEPQPAMRQAPESKSTAIA